MPINKLEISRYNVRKERDSKQINELAQSIQEKGILQPLLVRPEGDKYGIIIGSRRFTAAKKVNLKQVPVNIREMSDNEALTLSLTENLQRNDLEPAETVRALVALHRTKDTRQIADEIGKGHSYVAMMLNVVHLMDKLQDSSCVVRNYPDEREKKQKRAISLYHALWVADAFKPGSTLEKQDIDLKLALAITHLDQKQARLVIDVFKDDPTQDIDFLVELAERGELHRGMDSSEYKAKKGDKDFGQIEADINEHSILLCHALTNTKQMPEPSDDTEVDFVRKSREFRKILISELRPERRAGIQHRLNYLNRLLEETLDEIDKQDKRK